MQYHDHLSRPIHSPAYQEAVQDPIGIAPITVTLTE